MVPGSIMRLPQWHFQLGEDAKISCREAEMWVLC